jgi:hypothetical protein
MGVRLSLVRIPVWDRQSQAVSDTAAMIHTLGESSWITKNRSCAKGIPLNGRLL